MKKKIIIFAMTIAFVCGITGCQKSDEGKNNKNKAEQSEDKDNKNTDEDEDNMYSPIVAEDVEVPEADYPYMIKVNKAQNCITVYTLDEDEEYTVPERALICSVGEDNVPTGTFQLGETSKWQMLTDDIYGRYVTRVVDNVVFRSVDYLSKNEDALDVKAYNCLGETVSDSAIILSEADAKWISENCKEGTKVEIYEDEEEAGPLGKPLARLISDKVKWDPTDDSTENAWYVPISFKGIEDKTIKTGTTIDLLEGISAKDKYGNDLTSVIKVYGEVDVNKEGKYKVTYSCENPDGEKREVTRKIIVKDDAVAEEVQTEEPQVTNTPVSADTSAQTPLAGVTVEPVLSTSPTTTTSPTTLPANTPTPTLTAQQNTVVTTITTTTVEQTDDTPPVMYIVADSCNVKSLAENYLYNRIRVFDRQSGVRDVYISSIKVSDDGCYVVIYEAYDNAGNSSCISETVYLR